MVGTRTPAKPDDWIKANPTGKAGSFGDTAEFAELIVLAVKGAAAADALRSAGAARLSGKPIIDATNPIADEPPVNGVLRFFTDLDESLMERRQREFADARSQASVVGPSLLCPTHGETVDPRWRPRPTRWATASLALLLALASSTPLPSPCRFHNYALSASLTARECSSASALL